MAHHIFYLTAMDPFTHFTYRMKPKDLCYKLYITMAILYICYNRDKFIKVSYLLIIISHILMKQMQGTIMKSLLFIIISENAMHVFFWQDSMLQHFHRNSHSIMELGKKKLNQSI